MASASPSSSPRLSSLAMPVYGGSHLKRSSAAAGLDDDSAETGGSQAGPSGMRSGEADTRAGMHGGSNRLDTTYQSARPNVSPGRAGVSGPGHEPPSDSGSEPDTADDEDYALPSNLQRSSHRIDASGSGSRVAPSASRAQGVIEPESESQPDTGDDELLAIGATRQRNILNGLNVIVNGGTVASSSASALAIQNQS